MEASGKTISALDEKPVLNAVESFYYDAFSFLGIGRASGMGVGAIPLNDFISFHSIFGAPHSLHVFTKILRSVDYEYLQEQRES